MLLTETGDIRAVGERKRLHVHETVRLRARDGLVENAFGLRHVAASRGDLRVTQATAQHTDQVAGRKGDAGRATICCRRRVEITDGAETERMLYMGRDDEVSVLQRIGVGDDRLVDV